MKKGLKLFTSGILVSSSLVLAACQGTGLSSEQIQSTTTPLGESQQMKADSEMEKVKTISSRYDYEKTVERLKAAIDSKGMTLFAEIDHMKAAQEAGLAMQPATVLIFGNPKAGTPLMKKDPNFALQLPLKVLITEVDDEVMVSFTDTRELIKGSDIKYSDVENTLAGAEKLITNTVTK